jgi:hypothetical protein
MVLVTTPFPNGNPTVEQDIIVSQTSKSSGTQGFSAYTWTFTIDSPGSGKLRLRFNPNGPGGDPVKVGATLTIRQMEVA